MNELEYIQRVTLAAHVEFNETDEYYWAASGNNSERIATDFSNTPDSNVTIFVKDEAVNNWWALIALALVLCTAAGNVLVCLAIYLERRLQNVTNYFLMSLAITDLLVAVLVMPLGILTLVRGEFD